jgi:HopA1 effector protein family
MKHDNLKQIMRICEAIEINSKKEILLNAKVAYSAASDSYMNEPSGKIIFDELNKLIYRKFYINPCEPLTDVEPTQIELENNIALLNTANTSTIGFDEGWTMENNDENEFLIASKEKYRIQLKPGEFLNIPASPSSKNSTREVKIYRPKEYASIHEIFYYAYSNKIYDSDEDFMVRFYFNTSFAGNVRLMKLLTAALNEAELQFIFKCLIHPYYYGRSDTSVLYVNKQHANFIYNYLKNIYPLIKNDLRNSLPLFVHPIYKGIGFAEQPAAANESFGTHWSKIIAAGIMNAYENKLAKVKWHIEVLKHINENYYYTDNFDFYKNPQSHYPYSFVTM